MLKKTAPTESMPATRQALSSSRWLWRAGAALVLALALGLLYWGGFEQAPRQHPFHAPDFAGWLLEPMPHPSYGEMPVVPAGTAGDVSTRGLCAGPDDACGGIEITDDGRALLRFEGTAELLARVRHVREDGHLFAVSAKGDVWQLTQGAPLTWQRAELPAVAVGYNRRGRLIDQPELLRTFEGHSRLNAALFGPDGARLVTASDDRAARLWNSATGAPLAILEGHDGPVMSAAFSPDGRHVVTASDDGTVRLWDGASGASLGTLGGHGSPASSAAFSPDSARVVTGSIDGTARLWDVATRSPSLILDGHRDAIRSAAFSPDGRRVVTTSDDGTARIWDAGDGVLIRTFGVVGGPAVSSAAFSPDGTRLATAAADGAAQLWNANSGEAIAVFRGGAAATSAAFSPDGAFVLTASADGVARLWDPGWDEPVMELAADEGAVTSAAFSPDGTRIVTAVDDGTVRVWSFRPPRAVVTDVAADGAQTLWAVGRNGFAAQLGQNAAHPADAGIDGDLLSVASLTLGHAVAVGTDGLLVRLQRSEIAGAGATAVQQGQQNQQQVQQQQVQQQPQIQQLIQQQQIPDKQGVVQQPQQQSLPQASAAVLSSAVTRIEAAGERDLRAVQFLDEKRGWIAGDDGLLLHTSDGGETWQVLHDGGGYRLNGVHVQANGLGWAVGEAPDGRPVLLAAEDAGAAQSWTEQPHHLAPWWFLAGVPLFILAGLMNAWAWRLEPPPPAASISGTASNDKPLSWRDPDARVLRPVARGLSRFLRNVNSEPPLTIAITGRWGSGKSSLMNLLQEDLRRFGARPVWFNAWHHREEEHLLAALFAAVRRQGPPGWWLDRGLAFRLRLLWSRTRGAFVQVAYLLLFVAIAAVTVRLSLPGLDLQELLGRLAVWLSGFGDLPDAVERYGSAVLGSGGVALLALWLRAKMVALPADPATLMAALTRRASIGDFNDKLSFRDRFGEQFSEVCKALRTRRSPGLVILIDDLDRCQPEDTLKILEAVNYFVSAGPCIVVLGMDRRQVEYCVGLGFEKLVEGLPDDELFYDDELVNGAQGAERRAAKQRAFARHYLEKLINIEVPVPELSLEVLEAMLVPPEHRPRELPGEDASTWWRRQVARLWRPADAPLAVAIEAAPAARPPVTEPPAWLDRVKYAVATSGQVARVGVFAFVLGWLAVWGIEQVREWPEPEGDRTAATTPVPAAPEQGSSAAGTAAADAPQATAPTPVLTVDLARVAQPQGGSTDELPVERRWVWWLPTVLGLLIAGLWGVGAFLRRERQVVKDSADFRQALSAVRPLLEAVNPTPRAIKRYQNRMRYLAERLRPQEHEPGTIDVVLHWLGRRLGRPIVPDAWFEDGLRTAISEPALILLGAVETYAPPAFEQPADQVLAWLDRGNGREARARRRHEIWQKVKADFERRFAHAADAWPDAGDVGLYQSFVRGVGPKDVSRSAPPGSPGSRAVRPKPRAVA